MLGAGAIGGLFASQLQQHHIPVALATRHQNETSRTLTIETPGQPGVTRCEFAVINKTTPIHRLILTTKTYQSEEAVLAIEQQLTDDAVIIVLQNGMGTAEWLQAYLPDATILAATTTHGAFRKDNNKIVHAGMGSTWLGPLALQHKEIAHSIYQQWCDQGLDIEWDENIEQRLWLKLAINCAINPLTVIFDCKNGELLSNPKALEIMAAVADEFEQVYTRKFKQAMPFDLLHTIKEVAQKTAENVSSMRQDILNKRPTEITAINEYLTNQANNLEIDCPQNKALVKQVRALTMA